MEGHADFHDWEILLGPEAGEDWKPLRLPEDDFEDGVIKSDYFALDSRKRYQKGAAFGGNTLEEEEEEEKEVQFESVNPSWVDPESDSQFLDRLKGEVSYPGIEFPRKDLGGFWSDEQRSHLGSGKDDLCDAGGLEIGERADEVEEDEKGVGVEGAKEIEGRDMGEEKPGERVKTDESHKYSVEMVDKNTGSENVLTGGGEKAGMVWWKLPFELLKFCAFRVKPVWSISIAAAILGVLMLRKTLFSMKQNTASIHLKVSLDEKIASQLKIRVARLNEAFSVVRRVPIIKASLPAGGLTPWSVVGLQ